MEQTSQNFTKFLNETKNIYGPHDFKIKDSYGVIDYYKFYKGNKKKSTYTLNLPAFRQVTQALNKAIGDELAMGEDWVLPERMGTLEVRKRTPKPRFNKDGELVFNAPIDWQETLKLWYEDPECRKDRTVVYTDKREFCKVFFNRKKATFKNQNYYEFFLNRALYKKVIQRLHNKEIDLFEL